MARHLRWDSTGIVAMTPIQFASDVHKSILCSRESTHWAGPTPGSQTDLLRLAHLFQLGSPAGFPIDDSPEST